MSSQHKTPSKLKRLKDVTVTKPFVYGTAAWWLGKVAPEEHSHKWTIYVRGLENEDLGYYVKKVTFQLHTSFKDSTRVIEKAPFEVTETGWGEFSIGIKVFFHDAREPPVTLSHHLRLFPEGGTPQTTKRPVMSERYDEFVFVNPTEAYHKALMTGPSRRFDSHPLNDYFTTKLFVEQERKHIDQLTKAHSKVVQKIEDLRRRLHRANCEIMELEATS
jgi:YEATS domain-containing protein 4